MSLADEYFRRGLERGKDGCDSPLNLPDTVICTEVQRRAAVSGWKRGLALRGSRELDDESDEKCREDDEAEEDDSSSDDEIDDDSIRLTPAEYANFKKIEAKQAADEDAEKVRKEAQRRKKSSEEAAEQRKMNELMAIARKDFDQAVAVGGDADRLDETSDKTRWAARFHLCGWLRNEEKFGLFHWEELLRMVSPLSSRSSLKDCYAYLVATHFAETLRVQDRKNEAEWHERRKNYDVVENTLPFPLDLTHCYSVEDAQREIARKAKHVVHGSTAAIGRMPPCPGDVLLLCPSNYPQWVLANSGVAWAAATCAFVRLRRRAKKPAGDCADSSGREQRG